MEQDLRLIREVGGSPRVLVCEPMYQPSEYASVSGDTVTLSRTETLRIIGVLTEDSLRPYTP